jgi:hypothetical protein
MAFIIDLFPSRHFAIDAPFHQKRFLRQNLRISNFGIFGGLFDVLIRRGSLVPASFDLRIKFGHVIATL